MDSTNDFIIRLMIFKIMLCIQLELMLQNNYCSRSILTCKIIMSKNNFNNIMNSTMIPKDFIIRLMILKIIV